MAFQAFRSVTNPIFTTSPSALVATTEEALVPTLYTGIAANESYGGKIWKLTCGGIWSTSASASTIIFTPRVGLTSSGITLGANAAITVPASLTNIPWRFEFHLLCRTLGLAGANSTFIGEGLFVTNNTATAFSVTCGGTSASADATIATGLWIGKTLSVAGSMTVHFSTFESLN